MLEGQTDAVHVLLAAGASTDTFENGMPYDSKKLQDPAKAAARAALVVELGIKKVLSPLAVLFLGVCWDIIAAVKQSIDEVVEDLTAYLRVEDHLEDRLDLFQHISIDNAVLLFPRVDHAEFIIDMMEQCGRLGVRARDLLRELVGFPELARLNSDDEEPYHLPSQALMSACGTGDLELVKLLLRTEGVHLGSFGNGPWSWYHSTTTFAASCGHHEILLFILDNPPRIFETVDLDLGLVAVALSDDVEYASRLLAAGANPRNYFQEIMCSDACSALRVACQRANVAMVKLLLENGAKLSKSPATRHFSSTNTEMQCALLSDSMRENVEPPMPPPSDEENERRVEIIRLLVTAGASAADSGIEREPLYLRAFPEGPCATSAASADE